MATEYATLREKIAAEKAERQQRYASFAALWDKAHAAGMEAGNAAQPQTMVVTDGRQEWRVPEGPCGFASVVVYPGNCSFALWAKKNRNATKAYRGGMTVRWVSEFNQSYTRKDAYAQAFAAVLNDAGIKAYGERRLD